MADRYWVGGTGTWDGTSTTNWSTATGKSITASCASTTLTVTAGTVVIGDTVWSNNHTNLGNITANLGGGLWTVSVGGTFASQAMSAATAGASVPTGADSVFFDANSNSGTTNFTVTMANTPRLCNDFTASGLDGTMTLAGTSIGLTVSGSLTFQSTNFTRSYTGTTTFNATTTGKIITSATVSFAAVNFSGVGGGWTLGSAFTSTGQVTLTSGTLDTSSVNNYNFTTSQFSSGGSSTRTLNLNSSQVTISSASSGAFVVSSSLTLNAGFSTIFLTAAAGGFNGGGLTFYNVSYTATGNSSGSRDISGANTFNNLSFTTPVAAADNNITFDSNQIINGTLTVTGSNGNQRLFLSSDVTGTSRTLTCAAIAAISDVDFRDITIAGAAGTLSGTRLGNCGGNSNITFVAGKTVYWNLAAGGNWNANAWATSSGGAVATTNYPLPQDTAIVENTGLNTSATITISGYINISGVDMSTRTNAMTFATGSNQPYFNGNFSFGSGVTNTGTGVLIFTNRSTKTINSAGVSFTPSVTIDAPSGGIQLVTNNMTLSVLTERFTLTNGTLDLNGLTLSAGLFSTATGTKNITFNGGTFIISGTSTTAWNNAQQTNFTTTAGTGTGTISMTSASAKTFVGGSSTYNCTLNQGGAGTLTITGANTFSNITNTVQPAQITFPTSITNTFTSFSLSGTAGNLITLRSSSSGTRFILSTSSPVSVSYLDIQDSNGAGTTYIANDSINSGNNTGWSFIVPLNGDISASATVNGDTFVLFPANGLINATAAVVGNGYKLGVVNGLINSTATVVGNSIKLIVSNGLINSLATVVGKADAISIINGVITTSATVVGNNYRLFPSNGVINSSATVSASGDALSYLNGIINSAADVSANNIKLTFANGVIFSNADVIGHAIQQSTLNALINSSALVSGNLKKIGEEWIVNQPVSTTWFIQ